jgi:hypothetical protein
MKGKFRIENYDPGHEGWSPISLLDSTYFVCDSETTREFSCGKGGWKGDVREGLPPELGD